jgi:hypothetical protein
MKVDECVCIGGCWLTHEPIVGFPDLGMFCRRCGKRIEWDENKNKNVLQSGVVYVEDEKEKK